MAKLNETREQINQRVLATVQPVDHVISGIKARMTKPWPKAAGRMPTDAELMAACMFSKGSPGAEAGFMALQMRDEGCSILQLGLAFNCGPAHNHTRDHSGRVWHHFNRGKLGVGVFTLAFTAKGEKYLADRLAGVATAQAEGNAEKPAKGVKKAKGKAKRSKATKQPAAETPTSEARTAVVTVEPETNQQPAVEPTPELGGVDSDHDAVTNADLQALAQHFNQG